MSITINNGGVLHTLKKIAVNNNGTLYPLKTVLTNNNGVLYKIFTGENPYKLRWEIGDEEYYQILSSSENGWELRFKSLVSYDEYHTSVTDFGCIQCELTIDSTVSLSYSIEAVGDYDNKDIRVYNASNTNKYLSCAEDATITLNPGTYIIMPTGYCDGTIAEFIVNIKIS